MSPHSMSDFDDTSDHSITSAMRAKLESCVIGIDVGGTNTDAVVLQKDEVIAWHKTPTSSDIQEGVERAIEAVVNIAKLPIKGHVQAVKIGTTQFINAVLEQDSSKLDKVAVIRLCGPYSRGTPPFLGFAETLRDLVYGHYGYVDGGYQVDGLPIAEIDESQIKEQGRIIKAKSIKSIVVIGIYSPSNADQEKIVKKILQRELGPGYDVSCSHAIGRLGFLERENASILNASLRRFARHVIAGFADAIRHLGRCKLYITLNDGTLSEASIAAEHPVLCFKSGPTNSARGAALLAKSQTSNAADDREVLVVDVGGTTTDICALLKTGYPRQSAAFVNFAGIRLNYTIPDVHSLALGGGSMVRVEELRTSVGPDSVGCKLDSSSISFGGNILTATDLVVANEFTEALITPEVKESGLSEIARALEDAIDLVKTKQGDARVILVGGGSIIVNKHIAGVSQIIRPKYLEVANAVGAAMGRISGTVDKSVVPTAGIDAEIEKAKASAIDKCIDAGGNENTIEIVEIDVVPVSYATNGATRILVRVVGDLKDSHDVSHPIDTTPLKEPFRKLRASKNAVRVTETEVPVSKGSSYEVIAQFDVKSYRPRIKGDLWYLSETDLQFLQDGAGVLSVGSCGEPYSAFLTCLMVLRNGEDITIRRQDTLPDDAVVLVAGFMGSPSVYLERIPGVDEITDAMKETMKMASLTSFDAVIPNEIGGLNAFEAILAAHSFRKSVLDSDLVARAYPMVWQTVRCLDNVPIVPCSVADGSGKVERFPTAKDNFHAEDLMREACTNQGSLAGMCINPVSGAEAKTLPRNSFSHAWRIGRSIALSRSLKQDPITSLIASENGSLLFTGKIISVTRNVGDGFTRGTVLLEPSSETDTRTISKSTPSLLIEFENENLCAILKEEGKKNNVLACCPDLIVVLDKANGAPLGISDYKYGLRVSVVALRAPDVWTTERGLEVGGPKAFGLDMDYKAVATSSTTYEEPKSVWEMFGDGS